MATLRRVARDGEQFGSSTEIFPLSPTLKAGKAVREMAVPLSVRLWRWRRFLADGQGCLETLRGRWRTTVGLGGCGPCRWWQILIQVEVSQQIQKQPCAHTAMRRAERERARGIFQMLLIPASDRLGQAGSHGTKESRRDMYSRLKVTERENKLEKERLEMAQKQDKAE